MRRRVAARSVGLTLALALVLAMAGCGGASGGPSRSGSTPASTPAATAPARAPRAAGNVDWPRFGFDAARSGDVPAATGITAANAHRLRRRRVRLPGTVDSSPIYLHRARVRGARHDVFVVTTTYGKTLALSAATGAILWTYTPPGIGGWQGSAQITTASPVADPDRRFVYAASPDGRVHKLAVADGAEQRAGGWPVTLTRDPTHEKLASALNLAGDELIAVAGGYIGDAPPYQGHVVTIDRRSGRIRGVFNSLCSNRHAIIDPRSCPSVQSAIWARAGAVVEPGSGRLLVATGNGQFDGRTDWAQSALELTPDARVLRQNWTPPDHRELTDSDTDVGSTAPALLPGGLAVQGGKDGQLHLLRVDDLNGRPGGAGPATGGELQSLPAPGQAPMFTAPAVWRHAGRATLIATTGAGTAAYALRGGRLVPTWHNDTPGTSPVLAGGLLYVYDPSGGALDVYAPGSGRRLARLAAQPGHWNSPIVGGGRVALPEGDANDHETTGTLSLYALP